MIITVKSIFVNMMPGPVAQSIATSTTDPGATSKIPAWFYTLMEIDHEIISIFILLLPLIQERLMSVTS